MNNELPPYVMVVAPRRGLRNDQYRLYVTSEELVGVWVDSHGRPWWPRCLFFPRGNAHVRRGAALDMQSLAEQRSNDPRNFTIPLANITTATFGLASLLFLCGHPWLRNQGVLRIRQSDGLRRTLAVSTAYDAMQVHSHLTAALGSKLVNLLQPPAVPACEQAGKTVLFYDPSHGLQIEFLDLNGWCYLWYSGNDRAVQGRWFVEDEVIHFYYGSNTYNPVTKQRDGWESSPLWLWSRNIVDTHSGDVFGLATGSIPEYFIPVTEERTIAAIRRS